MQTYLRIALVATAVTLASVTSFAYAQEDGGTPNPPNPPVGNFCVRINSTLDDTYLERLTKQKSAITTRLGEIDAKVAQRRAEIDASRIIKRAEADAKRLERYAKLMEIAGSDSAKIAAVNQFKTALEAAVTARKAAVDTLVATYRAGHDQARSQRSIEILTAFSTYEGLMKSAITTAQAQCTAGTAVATVRTAFVASVKSAQDGHKTERTAITERYRVKMEALHATRKIGFDQAIVTFKTVAEAARNQLRLVFGHNDLLSVTPKSGTAPLSVTFSANLAHTLVEPRIEGDVVLEFGDGTSGVICKTLTTGVAACPAVWQGSHTYSNSGSYTARLFWDKVPGGRKPLGTELVIVLNN